MSRKIGFHHSGSSPTLQAFRAVQATEIMNREGSLIGTLTTYFRPVHSPSEQDLHVLDFYVRQAAGIIEHHKADAALRTSEERLRLAQMRTGIGIWDWNLRTGKLAWTPELEALFGLQPGTVQRYADFVSLRWTFRPNGHEESWLCIDWEESGGPNVVPPKRSGFGTSVVRELVPYELGGSADLAYLPERVRCKLNIPAQWLSTNIP